MVGQRREGGHKENRDLSHPNLFFLDRRTAGGRAPRADDKYRPVGEIRTHGGCKLGPLSLSSIEKKRKPLERLDRVHCDKCDYAAHYMQYSLFEGYLRELTELLSGLSGFVNNYEYVGSI